MYKLCTDSKSTIAKREAKFDCPVCRVSITSYTIPRISGIDFTESTSPFVREYNKEKPETGTFVRAMQERSESEDVIANFIIDIHDIRIPFTRSRVHAASSSFRRGALFPGEHDSLVREIVGLLPSVGAWRAMPHEAARCYFSRGEHARIPVEAVNRALERLGYQNTICEQCNEEDFCIRRQVVFVED